jgi:CubicO group peptidase (beta-lactamase class C family)
MTPRHRPHPRRREATLWLSLLAGCGGGSSANAPTPTPTTPPSTSTGNGIGTMADQLGTALATAAPDQPGVSVLVMQDGVETYSAQRGMANTLTRTTVSRSTGFRLASVSKPFTAVAVMQLVEQGRLTLADSILDHLPELPASWRPITLEHLLSHQSGIVDIFNDFWTPAVFNNMTLDGLLTYLSTSQRTLEFAPGTRGDYSNTGFMLLAKIVERRTGKRFGQHMAEAVFQPAGMLGSYINDEFQPIKPGDALNHGDRTTFYGFTTYFKGSMAQVSSADDFLHFFQALLAGRLVKPETLADMWRRRAVLVGGGAMGLGFFLTANGVTHQGEWDSFYTVMSIDTQRKRAWTVLTNSGAIGHSQVTEIDRIVSRAP